MTKSSNKDSKLGFRMTQQVVEGYIKYARDHPSNVFAFIKKAEMPDVNRELFYDFFAATSRQYKSKDRQKLLTRKGYNMLRKVCAMSCASTQEEVEEANDDNELSDDVGEHYLDLDFDMDTADKKHSASRIYLKFVGRKASKTQPADREFFNERNGAKVGEAAPEDFFRPKKSPKTASKPSMDPRHNLSGRRGGTHPMDADAAADRARAAAGALLFVNCIVEAGCCRDSSVGLDCCAYRMERCLFLSRIFSGKQLSGSFRNLSVTCLGVHRSWRPRRTNRTRATCFTVSCAGSGQMCAT